MKRSFVSIGLLIALSLLAGMAQAGKPQTVTSDDATPSTLTLTELRQPVKNANVWVHSPAGEDYKVKFKTDADGFGRVNLVEGLEFKLLVKIGPDRYYTPVYQAPADIRFDTLNKAPVASDLPVATDEDTALAIALTAADPEGDALTYEVLSQPTNGTLAGTAANLTYTPNADVFGTDSFTFKADDGLLSSNVATVTITVNAVNDAPVASDLTLSAKSGVAASVTLQGTDVDSTDLTYAIVDGPANGTVTVAGSTATYVANPNFDGQDSFAYKANDGEADSAPATVSVTVSGPFIITVNATDGTFTLPLSRGYAYDFTATYDGQTTAHASDANLTLTFPSGVGVYDVAIFGTFPAVKFHKSADKGKLLEIKQWGSIVWETMEMAFSQCGNLQVTATDAPDLSNVTSMYYTFSRCGLTTIDVSNWDVSNVTNMRDTFRYCRDLKEYIGLNNWDVGNVTDFSEMFYVNRSITSLDLTGWDTSSATNMSRMFCRCYGLKEVKGYETFDVSKVTNTYQMFMRQAIPTIDLSNWNTTDALTDISYMFYGAETATIKGLDKLDVTNVAKADKMFETAAFEFTTDAYEALLIAWADQVASPAPQPVVFDAKTVKYTPFGEADAAKARLLANNWVIYDGGANAGAKNIPAASIVSPVRISGWNYFAEPAITVSTGGAYQAPTPWADTLWKVDVELNPAAPVAVSVKYDDAVVKTQSVTWTPTLIDDTSSMSVTIGKGHSLLLGSALKTGSRLDVDVDGDGTYDLTGAPTDTFAVPYNSYGTFEVTTRIDGIDYGYMIVNVPEIIFPEDVACEIGYMRELTVGVPEDATGIVFETFNRADMMLSEDPKPNPAGSVKLWLKPRQVGNPIIVAKDAATGTILATKEVVEFDLTSQADKFIGVVDEFEDGSLLLRTNLTMIPIVPDLEVRLHIFKAGVTFDDSTLDKVIDTTDFTWDEDAGRYLHPYSLIIPENYDGGPCHTIKVMQDGIQVGQ